MHYILWVLNTVTFFLLQAISLNPEFTALEKDSMICDLGQAEKVSAGTITMLK